MGYDDPYIAAAVLDMLGAPNVRHRTKMRPLRGARTGSTPSRSCGRAQ